MKKIYLWLLSSLFACTVMGQIAFEEVLPLPPLANFDGVEYSSIAFADIDNDNDQDVLITGRNNSGQPIAKLYTNDGIGNYEEVTATSFDGVDESSIAFADIDNDNDQDVLITGDSGTGAPITKLYINDGNGNFTEVIDTHFEDVQRSSIAFADIDNDNDQDVLITGAISGSDEISKLYTNDGNGNFTEVTDTPFLGVNMSSIAFADIDNDNDQDVLITGFEGHPPFAIPYTKLYINDGVGIFTEVIDTPFEGAGASSIAFADIDNDNDQDVLISGILYTNDGNGLFTKVLDTPFDVVWYCSIAFTDTDNDNDQDVLITGFNGAEHIAKLYTNDGNGNFTEVLDTPFEGVFQSSIAFADIDSDGDQDVLITGVNGDEPISKLYTNNGDGNFAEDVRSSFNNVMGSSVAFTDIDNDNDQDVLISGLINEQGEAITKLYTNDGIGNYNEVLGTPFIAITAGSVAFADIDNDNDQDVLITGAEGNYPNYELSSKLYTNDGNGNFTEVLDTPFDGVRESSIAFADIDNDNDQDVLITGRSESEQGISKLYTNDGNGVFTVVSNVPFEEVVNSSIAFADVDNDNDQDVLITGSYEGEPSSTLYTNDGIGNFIEVNDTPFDGVWYGSIAFADIDNDNDQDVLITGANGYYPTYERISKLYTNDGNGNFIEVLDTPFDGVWLSSIAFADIDNDNDQDVLITGSGSDRIAKLYTNDGNGNFTEVLDTPFDGVDYSSIAFTDIDNDNDQDVLITGRIDLFSYAVPSSKIYRNITIVGIDENVLFSNVSIFPNPNNGLINIDLGSLTDIAMKVLNVSGQLIYYKENINSPIYQFELEAAPGVYILELSAKGEKQQFKLIKQ